MADQFVNGCVEKSDYVRSAFEELELGGVDPVAGKVRVVVDTKTVRKDDILKPQVSRIYSYYGPLNYCWKMRWPELTFGRLAASKTMLPHTASAGRISMSLYFGGRANHGHW